MDGVRKTFALNLRYYISKTGLSVKEFGESQLGGKIKYTALLSYTNGTFPPIDTAIELADALGITLNDLVYPPDATPESGSEYMQLVKSLKNNADIRELVRLASQASRDRILFAQASLTIK